MQQVHAGHRELRGQVAGDRLEHREKTQAEMGLEALEGLCGYQRAMGMKI